MQTMPWSHRPLEPCDRHVYWHLFVRLNTLPHSIKLLGAPSLEKSGCSGGHTMPGNVKAQRASNCAGITNDCDKTTVFQLRCFLYAYSCVTVCLALLCMFLEFTIQIFVKSEQKLEKKACKPIQP